MGKVLVNKGFIRHNFITGDGTNGVVIMGTRTLEAGYIYAPYIPMNLEPTIHNSNDFQPSREMVSRYTTTEVDNRFYSTISVNDFDTLGND